MQQQADMEEVVVRLHDARHHQYDARLAAIEERLDRGAQRFDALQESVDRNTAVTHEIRDLLELGRAGLRLLGYLGTAVVWLGKVAAAVVLIGGSVYALLTGARPPGK